MVKDAVPLIAGNIVGSFDKVSLTEMKTIFGYTVSRSECQDMENLFKNQIDIMTFYILVSKICRLLEDCCEFF